MNAEGELSFFHEMQRLNRYSLILDNTLYSGPRVAPLDPLEPAPITSFQPKHIGDLVSRGDFVFARSYLSEGGHGIAAYSFRNPFLPQVVDELQAPVNELAMSGSRIFGHSDRGVVSIEVSDPRNMKIVGNLSMSSDPLFFLQGIAAHGDLVCVTSNIYHTTTGALHVLAWGSGATLHEVGRVEGNWSRDPAFLDDETLVGVLDDRPALVDLSDPAKPQVVDVHPEITQTTCLATKGSIVYAGRNQFRSTAILERTGKSRLEVIGHFGAGGYEMAVRDQFLYLSGLQILEISDPRNPRFAGEVRIPDLWLGDPAIAVTNRAIVASSVHEGFASALLPCVPHPVFGETALVDDVDGGHDDGEDDVRDSELGSIVESLALDVEPNPFTTSLQLTLKGPLDANARIGIYDVTGRLVRMIEANTSSTAARTLAWDGRDSGGRDVGAGVYLVRLQSAAGDVLRRVVKIR
jgi:hypothetical protein